MDQSTIVFDFDGTLHDSMYIYRKALQAGYQLMVDGGYAPDRAFSDEFIAGNIGLNCEDTWERMCPGVPYSITAAAAARVGEVMDQQIHDGTARLFPDVPEMLQQLKDAGHQLVFLSNCRNEYRDEVRRTFGFDAWFHHYYTAEQFDGAPKEEIFNTIKAQVPGPYIVVGDRDKDRLLAEAHGLPFIGCLYGYGSRAELEGADYLSDDALDIVNGVEHIELAREEGAQQREHTGRA